MNLPGLCAGFFLFIFGAHMPVLLASKNLIPYVTKELASGPLIFAKNLLRGAGVASITMVVDSAQKKRTKKRKRPWNFTLT